MKRFLVFAGEFYYPQGGMHDFKSDHDTLEEAAAAYIDALDVTKGCNDWAQLYDSHERCFVM